MKTEARTEDWCCFILSSSWSDNIYQRWSLLVVSAAQRLILCLDDASWGQEKKPIPQWSPLRTIAFTISQQRQQEDPWGNRRPCLFSMPPPSQRPRQWLSRDPRTLPHPVHHLKLLPKNTGAVKEASSEATWGGASLEYSIPQGIV